LGPYAAHGGQGVSVLRIAVVGAGHMGSLHAQKVADLMQSDPMLELVGIADIRFERARALAERLGVRAAVSAEELLDQADAVIVAVPTVSHFEVVQLALEADCDVLVEKPIAATMAEGEKLLEIAEARGRLLQVGHLEWFNKAMQVMRHRIKRPRFIEAHRMGPYPDRATDIDVVRDLMIHDLDILQQLLGEQPERIESVGLPVLSSSADIANARLTFPSGCVANLTASRVSPNPMRRLRFFQLDGYFSIDFLAQSGVVMRRELNGDAGAPEIKIEKLEVDPGDALLEQLREFADASRNRTKPTVDGHGGLGALRTALRVLDAMAPFDELE
jgi:predicted dehydrogenase